MTEKLIDKLQIVDEKPNIAERLAYGSLGFAIMKNIKSKVNDNVKDKSRNEEQETDIQNAQDIANNIDIESLELQQDTDQLNR